MISSSVWSCAVFRAAVRVMRPLQHALGVTVVSIVFISLVFLSFDVTWNLSQTAPISKCYDSAVLLPANRWLSPVFLPAIQDEWGACEALPMQSSTQHLTLSPIKQMALSNMGVLWIPAEQGEGWSMSSLCCPRRNIVVSESVSLRWGHSTLVPLACCPCTVENRLLVMGA